MSIYKTMTEMPFRGSRKLRAYHQRRLEIFDLQCQEHAVLDAWRQLPVGSRPSHDKVADPWKVPLSKARKLEKRARERCAEEELQRYRQALVEFYYSDENSERIEASVSRSGRYRLVITGHATGPGTWSYSKGIIFSGSKFVVEVRRNYRRFPFLWMEDHVDGRDWLVCGEDYQGQTFVDLQTGEKVENLPVEAARGHGFCWAGYELLGDGRTLLVDGCYWACPYELRLYDVSDPASGWSLVEWPEEVEYVDSEDRVRVSGDRVVVEKGEWVRKRDGKRASALESERSAILGRHFGAEAAGQQELAARLYAEYEEEFKENPDHEDDPDGWEQLVDHSIVLQRSEDGTLVFLEEEKSDWLLLREEERRRSQEEHEDVCRQRQADSEPFQALLVHIEEKGESLRCGWMYPSQDSRLRGDEPNEAYFRVSFPGNTDRRTATLQWGVQRGDISMEGWVRGQGNVTTPTFPRTRRGAVCAWESARQHCAG